LEDKSNAKLSARLRERINLDGAISFHDWMQAALYDEREGYYRRTGLKRWGREGDYRTSPEQSLLFAQTFTRFFATLYEELEEPSSWAIWEAGAGAGHFAKGVLETLKRSFPRIFSATRYIVDEISPDARLLIRDRLASFGSRVEYFNLSESVNEREACIVFANELLDAFPVHRVTSRDGRLRELFVGMNDAGEFVWVERNLSTPLLSDYLERLNVKLAEGQLVEINLQAVGWLKQAALAFKRGYLVLVDYGAEANHLYDMSLRPQGSLRAFRRHRFVEDVLQEPGEQDITTTIDWTTVKKVCRDAGLEIVSFERQDRFLLRAGLLEELAQAKAEATSEAAALSLSTTVREMILPGGMSESFQVLVARKQV
jgi:SAM-dependent MidA family methyltransferase